MGWINIFSSSKGITWPRPNFKCISAAQAYFSFTLIINLNIGYFFKSKSKSIMYCLEIKRYSTNQWALLFIQNILKTRVRLCWPNLLDSNPLLHLMYRRYFVSSTMTLPSTHSQHWRLLDSIETLPQRTDASICQEAGAETLLIVIGVCSCVIRVSPPPPPSPWLTYEVEVAFTAQAVSEEADHLVQLQAAVDDRRHGNQGAHVGVHLLVHQPEGQSFISNQRLRTNKKNKKPWLVALLSAI